MASKNTGIQNYLNTLIFCIVANAVTIILLGVLFTDFGQTVAYLIITIEFGLITLIVVSLWQIYKYERDKKKELDDLKKAKVSINTCPDYYTRMVNEESRDVTCKNQYTTPDGNFEYTFATSEFPVDKVFTNNVFSELCTRMKLDSTSGPNFNDTAWTDIKAKCISINI
jgi:hypothetical protein